MCRKQDPNADSSGKNNSFISRLNDLTKTDQNPHRRPSHDTRRTDKDRQKNQNLNTHKTNHTNKTQVRREEKTQGPQVNTIG